MQLKLRYTARSVIAGVFARLFSVTASLRPSEWMAENIVVPDGPQAGQKWDATLTPYLVDIVDAMGPDDPCNKGVFKKGTQIGATGAIIGLVGHSIDCDPCRMMLVQPTTESLGDFIRDKLQPTIDGSKSLREKVSRQVSRDEIGSTTKSKRFPGGSLTLSIANSTAGLRSKTVKKIYKDEVDEYPKDLGGQGSPHAMLEARRETFLASGDWKEFNASTPTVKGGSYIDEEYEAGTKELWHVKCPHCSDGFFAFEWGQNFRFNETPPYDPHYVAPCCGSIISPHERDDLVRNAKKQGGGFRPTVADPENRPHRSWHINSLTSPFVPWLVIVQRWIKAQTDPALLKAFWNLTLGEAYEVKGDAPDHVLLFARRESYRRNHIPPRGLMLTAAADIQKSGIYYEVIAWAPNGENWLVDFDFLDGETTDANAGAFAKLNEVWDRDFPDAYGGTRKIDAFGVDSGYRASIVYEWCRRRDTGQRKAYALKGVDGWTRPALGTGTPQTYELDGKKVEGGVKVWPVGTWSLKGIFYEKVATNVDPNTGIAPSHYCHFPTFANDEIYFKQITSEYLVEVKSKGRTFKQWAVRPGYENHWLDCRIYNMSLADHLGLSRMTEEEWRHLARDRAAPISETGDLFAPAPLQVQLQADAKPIAPQDSEPPSAENPQAAAPDTPDPAPAEESRGSGWVERRGGGWLKGD